MLYFIYQFSKSFLIKHIITKHLAFNHKKYLEILFLGLVLLSCDETTDTEQTTSSQQSITYSEGVDAVDCYSTSFTEENINTYIYIFETMQTSCGKKAFDEKLLLPPQSLDTLSEETLNFHYGQCAANYYYAYLFKATNKVNNNYLQTLKEKLPFLPH